MAYSCYSTSLGMDAIDRHTDTPPEDKPQCVRVIYANEEKHVDIPIYAKK